MRPKATCPALSHADAAFHDRFTGRSCTPGPQLRRDLAELSAANELDLVHGDFTFRDKWGPELLALFTRLQDSLSADSWLECRTVLAAPAHLPPG